MQDLSQIKSASSLCYAQLDISSDSSIQTFAKSLKAKHGDQSIEVLINNAGIATKGSRFDSEVVKETLATNYYGTKMVSFGCLPSLESSSKSSRFVMSSFHLSRRGAGLSMFQAWLESCIA